MEKVLIIYNPVAGKDFTRPSKYAVKNSFPAADYDVTVYETSCTGDAIKAVSEMAKDFDKVVACGGDGTLNETVNGLLNAGIDIPVGYIPMGTTNDFAATLGIPSFRDGAVKTIIEGHTNEYDVGRFNDRYFNYVGCFGPGASVSYSANQKFKNMVGYPAYISTGFLNAVPVLKDFSLKKVKIEYDGKVFEGGVHYGAISNSTSVAGMFKFDKQNVLLNDGKFELLIVKKLSALKALPMLVKVLSGNFEDDSIIFVKAENIRITMLDSSPSPWTLDGEFGGNPSEIEFSVRKKAIRIYCPENPLFE